MKTYAIPNTDLAVSRIAYGCMKIGGAWTTEPLTDAQRASALDVCRAAYESGITLFDHADIYCRGKSEAAFAGAWKHIPRDRIVLQSKCGIRFPDEATGAPARYDFSAEHIVRSVEGSLSRLATDRLDILLLHRPDMLAEPGEVAKAFDELHRAGKVRYFGVSNHTPAQIELLKTCVRQPIVVNQVQMSIAHHYLVSEGMLANIHGKPAALATGILDYCRINQIFVQAWSPLAGGRPFAPKPDAGDREQALAAYLGKLAAAKGTTKEAIVLAWILRHPAGIQPIIGTTKPAHVADSVLADGVDLTREEWYTMLERARGERVP